MKVADAHAATESTQVLSELLTALLCLRKGDAPTRLPLHWSGLAGEVANAFNDVVEQNAAMAAELSRLQQLALTSKYKSEFLANMSHELRTPLSSLLILSDQLCKNPDGNLSPKQVEFSKTIRSSGNDLLMLINDILDLSKIESGTVAVDVSEVRLDDLHRSVERSFRHFAESKSIEFLIKVEPPLPKTLVTDVKRLQQVIKNLLSNAFKFTHQGHVAFSISTATSGWWADNEELNHASQVIAFSVSDTGIGISADKQQIIFEAFQQADGSTSRKYGGAGLGLAISRELSRLLGGEIRLVSAPGKGSTFTLYLPQACNPARSAHQAREEVDLRHGSFTSVALMPEPSGHAPLGDEQDVMPERDAEELLCAKSVLAGKKALIVDDDMRNIFALTTVLDNEGMVIVSADNGREAIRLVETDPGIDIVLMDIMMPEMDGIATMQEIRKLPRGRELPMVAVTAKAMQGDRQKCIEAGAWDCLSKPVDPMHLLAVLRGWLCR